MKESEENKCDEPALGFIFDYNLLRRVLHLIRIVYKCEGLGNYA